MKLFDQLHPDWQEALIGLKPDFNRIDSQLVEDVTVPAYENILRALSTPIDSISVVIIGQDPYPTPGYANGLAFSVTSEITPLPASLRNIFKELESDLGIPMNCNGDLTRWAQQGVLLLNRILTTESGHSLKHELLGWQEITNEVASVLGQKPVVAILWGKNAQELSHFFDPARTIKSVHPSPLSSYRGFFGSKPFSKTNEILRASGAPQIQW
ncbi:MAG: uracil-DNA glycosylase [Candidatus Planktophila sp.]|nr:uracil-DNA glycosylase [Candidatus Planktophila sp.]